MSWDWLLRVAIIALALAGVALLVRSLWRDLLRPRRREDPEADRVALYYLVIASGCGVALAIAGGSALMSWPGGTGLSAVPFLLGLGAASTIRFVPATHPAWERLIRRLRATG
jgi:hypothetical protein